MHVVNVETAAGTTSRSTRAPTWSCTSLTLTSLRLTCGRLTAAGSTTWTTGSALAATKTTHHRADVRRESSQHGILLDDDRQRSFLLEFVDLDLARGRINSSHHAAYRAETSGHDFLRIETKRVFGAVAKRPQLIANLQLAKVTRLCITKLDRVRSVAAHLRLVAYGNND